MFGRALFHTFVRYAPFIDILVNLSIFYFGSIFIKTQLIGNRSHTDFPTFESNFNLFLISIIYAILWMFNSYNAGYYRFKRVRLVIDEFFAVLPITINTFLELIAIYILLGGILWNDYSFFHRRFFIYSITLQFVIFLYYQYIVIRIYSLMHKKGYNIKLLMFAGINKNSLKVCEKISQNPFWGYKTIGFLDDDPKKAEEFGVANKYFGDISKIEALYFNQQFERLFCCLPVAEYDKTIELIKVCEKNNIDLHIVPDLFYFLTSKSSLNTLDGIPIITLYAPPLSGFGAAAKRTMDIFFSFFGLMAISPLLVLIAVLVKMSSKGPVFYKQERMGLDNLPFQMFKFRTMFTDAEQATGPKWADKNDPRVTKLGAFLRKTSLDELPQLFNVLAGDMSLVGPRPERPFFVQKFKEEIKNYMHRHRVKAGITGWAQVNGLRGSSTSLEQRIEYDLYYIENWSIWFDIKILFKTIMVVWNDKNAY